MVAPNTATVDWEELANRTVGCQTKKSNILRNSLCQNCKNNDLQTKQLKSKNKKKHSAWDDSHKLL